MLSLFARRGDACPNNVIRRRGQSGHQRRTLGGPAIVESSGGAQAGASPSRSRAARGCTVSVPASPFMKDETTAGAQFEYGSSLPRSDVLDAKRCVAGAGSEEVEQ